MLAGHLGAGLAARALEPQLGLGWLVLASLLPDGLLWLFVLCGWERASVPPDYEARRYLVFDFPYSHGVLACLGWSIAAGLGAGWRHGWRGGVIVTGTVLSHLLLDGLVHPADIPVFGHGPPFLGLGLWNFMPMALLLETALLLAGYLIHHRSQAGQNSRRGWGLEIFLAVTGLATVVGQLFAPTPRSVEEVAVGSLITLGVMVVVAAWLDRPARRNLMA